MKNFRHSKKALSPVVASIILIAVTVAVSIAVAVWMGALTTGFMATEQLQITSVTFNSDNTTSIFVTNTGTTPVTVTEVHINNGNNVLNSSTTVYANKPATPLNVTLAWSPGNNYQIKLLTSKGNTFMYTAIAPSS
jgi:flagellin-like protein